MNILINLSTLKSGGGQNVALNFLESILENKIYGIHTYHYLVVRNSQIHEFLKKKKNNKILTTSTNPTIRIFRECFHYHSIFKDLKIDIIYTYFGYGLFSSRIPQVSGVAVSNIFFPEIDFWQGNFLKVAIHKFIDKYRTYGIKKATGLIFENQAMEQRCHSLFQIPVYKTMYIPPSFNSNFEKEKLDLPELKKNTTKLLMLCGWQLNKNIMRVPEIAAYLKIQYNHPFQFIITAPRDNSKVHKEFISLTKKYQVDDMISIIGPVNKQQLESLYLQIDFVLLMSKLESFSNNIIEAWHFKKPLIVSDEKWSNEICQNAAIFINRESPDEISRAIKKLASNFEIQNMLISEGIEKLKKYPSIIEKTISEIAFLEKIYHDSKTIN